jgi:DOMON domain
MAKIMQMLGAILVPLLLLFSGGTAITLTGSRALASMEMSPANSSPGVATEAASQTVPQIQWGSNATHIEIQLTYPTTGWLALGLSPHGGMDQSDVLFGYVDDQTQEVIIQVSGKTSFQNPMKVAIDLKVIEGSRMFQNHPFRTKFRTSKRKKKFLKFFYFLF